MELKGLLRLSKIQLLHALDGEQMRLNDMVSKIKETSKKIISIKEVNEKNIADILHHSHMIAMHNVSLRSSKDAIEVYERALYIKASEEHAKELHNDEVLERVVTHWAGCEIAWFETAKEEISGLSYEDRKEWAKANKVSAKDFELIKSTSMEDIRFKTYKMMWRRYVQLIQAIEAKTGKLIKVIYVGGGANGDLNFKAMGEKANVEVFTIGAGGYNIQRYHYRTLIKIINK